MHALLLAIAIAAADPQPLAPISSAADLTRGRGPGCVR